MYRYLLMSIFLKLGKICLEVNKNNIDMKNITVEEIMDVIYSTSIEMYNSEWNEMKQALVELLESKEDSQPPSIPRDAVVTNWDDDDVFRC